MGHRERGRRRCDHSPLLLAAASAPQDGGDDEAEGEADPEANERENHEFMFLPRPAKASGSVARVDHDQICIVTETAQMTRLIAPS